MKIKISYIALILVVLSSCYKEETLNVPVKDEAELTSQLDEYIDDHFTQPYNMAVRYKYVDQYVERSQRVTPPRLDIVQPMLDFVEYFWIEPYLQVPNGEGFFKRFVPAEIIFLGGLIYNGDGTVTLGTADAGARITFTNVNALDVNDEEWRTIQLHTVYHEFSHIVHQNFKLPNAFETISPNGYTSAGSWYNLTDEEALQRGFVSPYATTNPNEDFAETVAFYLFDPDFEENFVTQTEDCTTADCENENAGKAMILEKISSIRSHYERVTGVSLDLLRADIQSRL